MNEIVVRVTHSEDKKYTSEICDLYEVSAKQRGTGIAKRSAKYIDQKIEESSAIIALAGDELVGFCYIESWSKKKYVANSGLTVKPAYRSSGVATKIKRKAFLYSRKKYPNSKLFGLTTSLPVMKINSDLSYVPVTYSELTNDEQFWSGCKSCVNYEILRGKNRSNCMCTAMLFDPEKKNRKRWNFVKNSKLYARFMRLKKRRLKK